MRAGGPPQELILPAARTGTLSQQQAKAIVKATAGRLAVKAVRHGGASDQYRDEQMHVERLGVAREKLCPRNGSARQPGTLASQVDQFCTVREAITTTRSHDFEREWEAVLLPDNCFCEAATSANASDARVLAKPKYSAVGFDAEGMRAPHTAVMTCSPLMNDFEVLVRSRETVVEDINWEQGQLTEVLVVEHQHQRLMEERWNPATSAVKDVDDAMIDEMLKAIEELDGSHDLSEEDEAIIDALLEELDLENADQERGGRSELLELEGGIVYGNGVHKMLTESICDVTKATGRSETDIEKQKGSASSQVLKRKAVLSDIAATPLMKLSPNAQLSPKEGDSGYPTGSIVSAERKVSKWDCNDGVGRPTESMADGKLSNRWDNRRSCN